MHILFIGYGKTSQKLAKPLFEQGHQISTISLSPKTDTFATHYQQNVKELSLDHLPQIDWVYVLLSPSQSTAEAYKSIFLDSVAPIVAALAQHAFKRLVVVSSTRVYGENHGEDISDESPIQPSDEQGQYLREMELAYLKAFPQKVIIVRPSGIYGESVARLTKMAEQSVYPNQHWSNRIHHADLVRFLAHLIHVEPYDSSYIVTDNQPKLLPEILQWFQEQLGYPKLKIQSDQNAGKKLYATRLDKIAFELRYPHCFDVYLKLLSKKSL